MSVSSLVDKTIPIIVQPKKFEWTTRPIFIKDKDGVPLRFAFGRFKIHLSIDGGGRFIKTFTALEPALRDGYVHPHIASHIPCLGNAEQLLVEALRANDIAAAIHITDEHLTGYNPASPYRMLETWVHSRYNQALCQCGMVIISECGCDSCSDCGAALLDPSKTSEHGCGCCTKCCKAKHTQTALTKINNAGINGSACVHAKLVKVRRTESVFYDRQA